MTLGNIVSNTKISGLEGFNVVDSIDKIIDGLPTLIIGYENVKKYFPSFDITTSKIDNQFYWTFKKNEKRDKYEEDLNFFVKKVYTDLVDEISYVFVDPIQYRGKTLLKIVRKILNTKKIISYMHDNMVYIYLEKIIFGIDLKLISYIGLNVDKIKCKINAISTVFLDKNEILIEYKNIMSIFENKYRYLPYMYFIKNGESDTSSVFHISRET